MNKYKDCEESAIHHEKKFGKSLSQKLDTGYRYHAYISYREYNYDDVSISIVRKLVTYLREQHLVICFNEELQSGEIDCKNKIDESNVVIQISNKSATSNIKTITDYYQWNESEYVSRTKDPDKIIMITIDDLLLTSQNSQIQEQLVRKLQAFKNIEIPSISLEEFTQSDLHSTAQSKHRRHSILSMSPKISTFPLLTEARSPNTTIFALPSPNNGTTAVKSRHGSLRERTGEVEQAIESAVFKFGHRRFMFNDAPSIPSTPVIDPNVTVLSTDAMAVTGQYGQLWSNESDGVECKRVPNRRGSILASIPPLSGLPSDMGFPEPIQTYSNNSNNQHINHDSRSSNSNNNSSNSNNNTNISSHSRLSVVFPDGAGSNLFENPVMVREIRVSPTAQQAVSGRAVRRNSIKLTPIAVDSMAGSPPSATSNSTSSSSSTMMPGSVSTSGSTVSPSVLSYDTASTIGKTARPLQLEQRPSHGRRMESLSGVALAKHFEESAWAGTEGDVSNGGMSPPADKTAVVVWSDTHPSPSNVLLKLRGNRRSLYTPGTDEDDVHIATVRSSSQIARPLPRVIPTPDRRAQPDNVSHDINHNPSFESSLASCQPSSAGGSLRRAMGMGNGLILNGTHSSANSTANPTPLASARKALPDGTHETVSSEALTNSALNHSSGQNTVNTTNTSRMSFRVNLFSSLVNQISGRNMSISASGRHMSVTASVTASGRHLSIDPSAINTAKTDSNIRFRSYCGKSVVLKGHSESVRCLKYFQPDSFFSGSGDGTIKLWRRQSSDLGSSTLARLRLPTSQYLTSTSTTTTPTTTTTTKYSVIREFKGHTHVVSCIDILSVQPGDDKDVSALLISGSFDTSIRIWNVDTGSCERILEGHSDYVNCLAVLTDGRTLVSGSRDCCLKFWEISKGLLLRSVCTGTGWILCVVVLDSSHIAITENDSASSRIKVMRIEGYDGECGRSPGITHSSVTGEWAVTAIQTLLAPFGTRIREMVNGGGCVCGDDGDGNPNDCGGFGCSSSYSIITAAENKSIRIWNNRLSGAPDFNYVNVQDIQVIERPETVLFIDDGVYAVGYRSGLIRIWSDKNGFREPIYVLNGHSEPVWTLALSDRGELISGSGDGTIRVWF